MMPKVGLILGCFYAFSLTALVSILIVILVTIRKKALLRSMYELIFCFCHVLILAMSFLFNLFAAVAIFVPLSVLLLIGHFRTVSGKDKTLQREEKAGRIRASFNEEDRYDLKVKTMTDEQREIWYKDFNERNKMKDPLLPFAISLSVFVIVFVLVLSAPDFGGWFAAFD